MIHGFLAELTLKYPFFRGMKLHKISDLLVRMALASKAVRRIGTFEITFDCKDVYQRWMLFGLYEPETATLLNDVLREGDVYVDIGAQLGYTAAIAAAAVGPSGRIILFEPDPIALSRLNKHVNSAKRKQNSPRIDLMRVACSDSNGTLGFNVAKILGHSRIVEETEKSELGELIEVAVRRGDEILFELNVSGIRFLKIDVEGHEPFVLRGVTEFLREKRVDIIYIEKNPGYFESPSRTPSTFIR